MSELTTLFYIGIITPTVITVAVFVTFLICWFRCNLKDRLLHRKLNSSKTSRKQRNSGSRGETRENTDKGSQHSVDSAIDVRDMENNVVGSQASSSFRQPSTSIQNRATSVNIHHQRQAAMALESDINLNLVSGSYPSREKLNDEIHSEPPIYEKHEEVQKAILDDHKRRSELIRQRNLSEAAEEQLRHDLILATHKQLVQSVQQQRALYSTGPTFPYNKRHSHSSATAIIAASIDNNKSTDYGFAPWGRPRSIAGPSRTVQGQGRHTRQSSATMGHSFELSNCNSTGNSIEILHV